MESKYKRNDNCNLKVIYWQIFKENNMKMRRLFFMEPTIQFLWGMYTKEKKVLIQAYL